MNYQEPKWTRHYIYINSNLRIPKWYYKPIQWLGEVRLFRYYLDRFINLFISYKGKTIKERWNFWGGGGIVCWWIRRNITHN